MEIERRELTKESTNVPPPTSGEFTIREFKIVVSDVDDPSIIELNDMFDSVTLLELRTFELSTILLNTAEPLTSELLTMLESITGFAFDTFESLIIAFKSFVFSIVEFLEVNILPVSQDRILVPSSDLTPLT